MNFDYNRIKQSTTDTLLRYVNQGIPTGDFLRAVLSNNMFEAFGRADSENYATMGDIVAYIYNELPSGCWGSPDKYKAWLKMKQTERENNNG